MNDGSPDKCPQICDEFAKDDIRVKVIHQVNRGLSEARNVGLKLATGDYVVFLDSDDFFEKGALSTVNKQLEKSKKHSVYIWGFHIRKKKGTIKKTYIPKKINKKIE